MSHFTTVETKFLDVDILCEALEEVNPKWVGHIERHATPEHLYGYRGDKRAQKADLIIRRNHISNASNDIGFLKKEDGTYEAIISEYDTASVGYNRSWLDKLSQVYAEKKSTKELKKRGWAIRDRVVESDGRITLRVQRWR